MLLESLIICHLTVLTVANPFHKYPFVFLLDVGNEELEKTNTEQIRLSIPGGSLALRYPAIGDGDTIAHVRVSGIDFGTDLKTNIYDGGPGYKYVVLVFMGNPGVPYDAIVTVQTMPSDRSVDYGIENSESMSVNNNLNEDDDPNDSAEETSDESEEHYNKNAELMQSSSNVYNYAQNKAIQSDDYQDNSEDYDDKDIHKGYSESPEQIYNGKNVEVKDYIEEGDEDDVEENEQSNEEKFDSKEDYQNDNDGNESMDATADKYSANENDEENEVRVDSNLYNKYKALRPHLYDNVRVYPLEAPQTDARPVYEEDPVELDQMFNDEEIHNDAEKYQDSNNNNYVDSDESSAVAY